MEDCSFVYRMFSLCGEFTLFIVQSLDNTGLIGMVINYIHIIWTYTEWLGDAYAVMCAWLGDGEIADLVSSPHAHTHSPTLLTLLVSISCPANKSVLYPDIKDYLLSCTNFPQTTAQLTSLTSHRLCSGFSMIRVLEGIVRVCRRSPGETERIFSSSKYIHRPAVYVFRCNDVAADSPGLSCSRTDYSWQTLARGDLAPRDPGPLTCVWAVPLTISAEEECYPTRTGYGRITVYLPLSSP